MAVEWMVCAVCGQRKNPVYNLSKDSPDDLSRPKSVYGDHNKCNGERCPGSDQSPSEVYWGNSVGCAFPNQERYR